MQELFSFWFVESGPRAIAWYRRVIAGFESNLAIATTAKNLSKPLFQDYTFQGRVIGFGFRLLRIFFGSILYAVIAGFAVVIYLLWLVFPILCIVAIVGSFVAPTIGPENLIGDTWKP